MTSRRVGTAVLVTLAAGCQFRPSSEPDSTNSRFAVEFRIKSDDGEPLAEAVISNPRSLLGRTGSDGRLKVDLRGTEGEIVPVSVVCPEGYTSPTTTAPLRLTHIRKVSTDDFQATQFEAACKRNVRDIVILVHAHGGADLPLRVDGRPAGSTNADGIAHVLVHAAHSIRAVNVSLDTSMRKDLKPRNPSRTYELSGNDGIVVFDQTLVAAPKPLVRTKDVQPRRHVPYRVD